MQPSTRVILVRHGRSTFNEQGRYQGSSDEAVLTPKGLETARQVGQYLSQTPIDTVYASPLKRVQQTTNEMLKAMVADLRLKPLTINTVLREIDLSLWEGLTYQQVQQQFAKEYYCWQQRPHEFELPLTNPDRFSAASPEVGRPLTIVKTTYFPVRDLYRRMQQFWANMLPRHPGKTILIVSHGGTNHALISTALGISPAHHHSLQQSNCGISCLEFNPQGPQLQQLNQTTFLGEALPKLKAGKQGLRLLLLPTEGLTRSSCHRLAKCLITIPLHFCITVNEAHAWTRVLFQHHPNLLHLKATQSNFLQTQQQGLLQSFQRLELLTTGVAIAPTASIQTLLIQTLGGKPDEHAKLPLQAGQLSVIHFPTYHRPVVQAINI
jgi:broad specificity phosphatase PhoE